MTAPDQCCATSEACQGAVHTLTKADIARAVDGLFPSTRTDCYCSVSGPRGDNEATRLRNDCRFSGFVAADGSRAAAGDAADWLFKLQIGERILLAR